MAAQASARPSEAVAATHWVTLDTHGAGKHTEQLAGELAGHNRICGCEEAQIPMG